MSAEASEAKKLVDELNNIEFNSASDISAYATKSRKLLKALSMELEYASQELQARLAEVPPPPGESNLVARRKAKAVARHLKRAAEGAQKSGVEVVRTWGSLQRHYEHILKPRKGGKKPIDLSE